jgi:hypothetical protein
MLLFQKEHLMNSENQPKSRAEWFNLVKDQMASGLTQTEFCKSHNLILARFTYYKKQLSLETDQQSDASFSSVIVNQSLNVKATDIRIELPNGFRCYIPTMIAPEKLKQLISVLISC